jgi:adhesin/invasin
LVNNFSSQVAGPVPVTVYVVDNCGNLIPDPKKSGAPKADVTIQFSAGDPSAKTMQLTDKKHAGYTITWVPDQNANMTQVTVQAKLGNLNGSVQSTGTQQDAAAPADTQATILSGNSVVFGQVLPSTAPVLLPNATLNNLNPQQGAALAPGTVVEIFGANLTTRSPVKFHSLPLPTSLNGTSITIGGLKAPLYYVSKTQIDAQVPYELEPGRQYEIVVNVNGTFTVPDHISLVAAAPGLAATSDGRVLAEHANGKLITAAHPALANETIVLFLVGMGEVTPAVASGMPAPTKKLTHVTTAPVVTLDNTAGPSQGIKFAGLTPGFVGLYQVNFVVPAGAKPGTHQIEVSQGSFHSNSATLPVGNP